MMVIPKRWVEEYDGVAFKRWHLYPKVDGGNYPFRASTLDLGTIKGCS